MRLRDYQESAIQEIRRGIQRGRKRQILYMPTGSGKTRTAGGVIESALNKGSRVAFLCNRIELVQQASAAMRGLGIDHGIIQGSNSYGWDKPLVICSIQTVARRGIPGVDVMIIDEAHSCAGSGVYRELIRQNNNLPIIGLTATPFSKGLGKIHKDIGGPLFESIVVGATIPDLIDRGYLVDVEVYAPSEPDLTGVRIKAGDYDQEQLEKAVDKTVLIGDIVSHYKRLANNKLAVCFATSVAHSKHIVEAFLNAGIMARHVDGYMDEDERREIIDSFKAGDFQVLSNCYMLAEGFDCPETEVVILAAPTRSLVRYIQMCGRALRPVAGKTRALILDHSGVVRRMGFPTDELPLHLDDGKPREQKQQERLPKVCKSCHAVKRPGVSKCPHCGFEPVGGPKEVEVEAGELKKLERKKKKYSTIKKQEIYSALLGYCKEHNKASGYAAHTYREMVGVWPKGLNYVAGPMTIEVQSFILHKRIAYANRRDAERIAA